MEHLAMHRKGRTLRLDPVADGIIRVRLGDDFPPSVAERYGILDATPDADCDACVSEHEVRVGGLSVVVDEESLRLELVAGDLHRRISILGWDDRVDWDSRATWLKEHLEHWCDRQESSTFAEACFASPVPPFGASFELDEGERIYGFGEAADGFLVFNGKTVLNRVLYTRNEIPIPLAMSSRGWGVFFNTGWWHGTDIGARDKGEMYFYGDHGELDFFLLLGGSLNGLTRKYTRLTGAPCVLPRWMYGLSYIANYHARNYDVLQDARDFRREGVACDMISLEPGWMEKEYDFSTRKDWNEQKFMIRDWMRAKDGDRRNNYPGTFIAALRRYGFKLSLWLCCDHDLTAEEERRAGNPTDFGIEPWFSHLRKFIDDGVDGFKLDPSQYVDTSDPAHAYGNGMTDPEIHNLLQTVLSKQMHLGFEEHAGRRPMHHYCGGYSGIQRWGATTCGDSGGGIKSLGWIINLGMHGVQNATCDMDIHIREGLHYAMFTAWPLLDGWAGFLQPWYAGPQTEKMFHEYVRLRYAIVPYTYSAALEGYLASMPIVRGMPLAFPDASETWDVITQYMYGPYMLISSFAHRVYLPEGLWLDMWNDRVCQGGRWIEPDIPADRGGGFFLQAGAIVPMWAYRDFIDETDETDMELMVYPFGESGYTLYEDDGVTGSYRGDAIASTRIECARGIDRTTLVIHPRQGHFSGMKSGRSWKVKVLRQDTAPRAVTVNGQATGFRYQDGTLTFQMAGAEADASTATVWHREEAGDR